MKKTFQDVLKDIEEKLIGKDLRSISGTAAVFKITEVDYANNKIILDVQGKRNTWTFARMEQVWKEMYYKPAANVEVLFGGSGSSRNQVETMFASLGYVEWVYINSKKCIAYLGKETHPYGELKHMEKEQEAYYNALMSSENPRNPILDADEVEDEYTAAAEYLMQYVVETGYNIPVQKTDIEATLEEFKNRFSPNKLECLSDEELLATIFYTDSDNSEALCYWLERNKECRDYFGSIAGGSAYKFGLFQKAETGNWMTGSPARPKQLADSEALEIGKNIRDALIKGAACIDNANPQTVADYEKLDAELKDILTDQFYNLGWIHKYLSMVCPDKLSSYHLSDWQCHVLRCLKIRPSDKYYVRSGQLAMVSRHAGWFYREFSYVISDRFGDGIKEIFRIGTSDRTNNYAAEWAKKSVIGIGWKQVGSLEDFAEGDGLDRQELQAKLKEIYYPSDERTASRKTGELIRFYKSNINSIFVVMEGERLVALADSVGRYFYDPDSDMSHRKSCKWHFRFTKEDRLPEKTEGKLTSCIQITNEDNLLYLYEKYYYGSEVEPELEIIEENKSQVEDGEQYMPIRFDTGIQINIARNQIVFGAPGTGKSFTLNQSRKIMLGEDNETDYERVTFHPDYSYANFVGTYKPVPVKDENGRDIITYKYVPGPFMRVYVNALKNGRTENPKPFLLIIEEINRANVAAVFGDIFQLLDRNENGVSEYPIQATEDMKKYLSDELHVPMEECNKIRIPDNMFIWATMNSADQGVFPMDTAFKRRWDFTYLGIDDNDEEIQKKTVVLGNAPYQHRVEWNSLRKAINKFLADKGINEDKQLGPYFLARKKVVPEQGDEIDRDVFVDAFKNKVIMYLFEDAAKQKRQTLFDGCQLDKNRYSSICREFDTVGIFIFHQDIVKSCKYEDVLLDDSQDSAAVDSEASE